MPTSYVFWNGRLERHKDIDRGEMLVWTEEEWRKRFMEQYDRIMARGLILIVAMYVVLIVMIAWMALTQGTGETLIASVVIVIVITLVFGLITPLSLYQAKRGIAKAPATGLYRYGLQLTPFYFIPYLEMARTERKMLGWPKKLEAVVIHPRSDRRNLLHRATFPWSVRMSFLGEEGAHKLEAIVLGDDGSKTPPKLVIYE